MKSERGEVMTGTYSHTLDAKGRLFIPACLRDKLGKTFHVTVSPEGCLSAYPEERWSRLMEKYGAMPSKARIKLRPIFANAAECELDAQGRILLPLKLRNYAGLTKNVTVVGAGVTVEIWDTDSWNAVEEAECTPEALSAAFEELDF